MRTVNSPHCFMSNAIDRVFSFFLSSSYLCTERDLPNFTWPIRIATENSQCRWKSGCCYWKISQGCSITCSTAHSISLCNGEISSALWTGKNEDEEDMERRNGREPVKNIVRTRLVMSCHDIEGKVREHQLLPLSSSFLVDEHSSNPRNYSVCRRTHLSSHSFSMALLVCSSYNRLLNMIHTSLQELLKAMKGLVVLSQALEEMSKSLYNNAVPAMWAKVVCLSVFLCSFLDFSVD